MKRKICLSALFCLLLGPAVLAGPAQTTSSLGSSPARLGELRSRSGRNPASHFQGPGPHEPSHSLAAFRQRMFEELRNIPTLNFYVLQIMELQQERSSLQRRRQQIAHDSDQPSDAQIRQFHSLLKREDELTTRQQQLLKRFAGDSEKIQSEIMKRRQAIASQLDKLNADKPARPDKDSTQTKTLYRTLRFYDFLFDRMANLREAPNQTEWLNPILKGTWGPDEPDTQIVQLARQRLQQLSQEQENLRRKLQLLDDQIFELREMLDNVRPASPPPPPRGAAERDAKAPQSL